MTQLDLRPYLAPLTDNAALELDALASGVRISATARAGLADALSQRLEIATSAVLRAMADKGAISAESTALLGASWGLVFKAHADLVPIVERIIEHWRNDMALLLRRVATDAVMLGESPVIEDAQVVGGAWKKSPTLRLTFGSGRQWFYKHHTMHIAAWLMDLIRELNTFGGIGLHTRSIVACAGYGWDSAVVARPCTDAAEVDRYFTRVGMWLRLMQLLGGNDLHAKNLIAAGDHPIPIDHENLFQPARGDVATALGKARIERQRSPLESGLLPHLMVGEAGRRAVNAGGLEVGGNYHLPFRTPDGYPDISLPRTLPTLNDQPISARDGRPAILAGYDAMHATLAGPGRSIVDAFLQRAAILEVRVLRRPAHTTRRIIVDSLQPAILLRPGARLAHLQKHANPADLQALIELEVPRQYELAALDFVRRDRSDAEHHLDRELIATAIHCADPAPAAITSAASGSDTTALAAAVTLGDHLIARAHADRQSLHWLGVVRHPLSRATAIEILPNDLLSGNAGLAVVLAALFDVTRLPRFADAARAALQPVARAFIADTPAWRPWGAYQGCGAQLYAIQRTASLLGGAATQPSADQLNKLLSGPSGGVDLATGTAGLLAVAARVLSPKPAWLDALANVLVAAQRSGPPSPYPDGAPADLPDAATSITFALHRVGRAPAAPDLSRFDVGSADTLLRRHHDTGRWLSDDLSEAYDLSAMRGIGAVVLALLRASSADVPSLWSLD